MIIFPGLVCLHLQYSVFGGFERVIYVILSLFGAGFAGLLLYLILMLIMPAAPAQNNVEDVKFEDATKKEDK